MLVDKITTRLEIINSVVEVDVNDIKQAGYEVVEIHESHNLNYWVLKVNKEGNYKEQVVKQHCNGLFNILCMIGQFEDGLSDLLFKDVKLFNTKFSIDVICYHTLYVEYNNKNIFKLMTYHTPIIEMYDKEKFLKFMEEFDWLLSLLYSEAEAQVLKAHSKALT